MQGSLASAALCTLLYGLGLVGFVAVTALPLRFLRLVRRTSWALRAGIGPRLAYLFLTVAGIAAIILAGENLVHVARCLLGLHCGANAASGWMALASVGVWYVAFESIAFVIVHVALRQRTGRED